MAWLLKILFIGKVYQPIVKQSSYKSELLECCNNIKSQANRVKNEAQICMQKRNVDSNHLQQGLLSDLKDQNQAILNLFYKFLLSSEARSIPISGRSGKCSLILNAEGQIRPRMISY